MKQKTHDTGTPDQGNPETTGDGVFKDLVAKAAKSVPLSTEDATRDPRRRAEITFNHDRNGPSDHKQFLYINGEMWAEVQWSGQRKAWCIQDACGYCLTHIEHLHLQVPNTGDGDRDSTNAIEKAKEMIRDGRMPAPEQARAEFLRRTGRTYEQARGLPADTYKSTAPKF